VAPAVAGLFSSTPELAGAADRPITLYVCADADAGENAGDLVIPHIVDPVEGRVYRFTRAPCTGRQRRVAAFESAVTESSDGQYVHIKSADAFADL
jgi:hypothetical protein